MQLINGVIYGTSGIGYHCGQVIEDAGIVSDRIAYTAGEIVNVGFVSADLSNDLYLESTYPETEELHESYNENNVANWSRTRDDSDWDLVLE